ncbi:MAG: hypothetical protein ACXW1W_02815 [Methylococcaceae bacterium]
MDFDMTMNLKLTQKALKKLSILFPLPVDGNDAKAFFEIWQLALEDLDENDVVEAVKILLLTMTRLPYPAELRATVKLLHTQQETSLEKLKEYAGEGIDKAIEGKRLTENIKVAEIIKELKGYEAIEALADKIVLLARVDMCENGSNGVAEKAVLLAQHRLFGSIYIQQLFTGNHCC